ncbi:MAG: OmpH family outer membrane protein [Deltaproteobacteria bacterium]|nr:OmpH family outer membrane protein [Deltaproteobacteria bacterium]
MRHALKGLVLCLVCLPALAWAQEALRIGYVDLQRALNESEAGRKAKETFKVEVDRMEQSLEKRKSEVEKLKDELEKKGLLLREEERDNLERDYRQKLRDFQRLYDDSQQELKIKDRDLTGRILEELRQVILEMGEQGSYTVILEGNNTVVLYGAKAIDLTDTVIKTYNQKGTKVSSKAGNKTAAAE